MFPAETESPGELMTPERVAATDRIEAQLAEVAGLWNATSGWLVSLIAEGLAHDVWAQSGVHSPEQWVAWNCGLSAGRARQLVGLARRLEALPACRAALEAGELTIDQAVTIAQHAPAWADGEVTDVAKQLTVAQLTRHLRRYAFDPAGPTADSNANADGAAGEDEGDPGEDGSTGGERRAADGATADAAGEPTSAAGAAGEATAVQPDGEDHSEGDVSMRAPAPVGRLVGSEPEKRVFRFGPIDGGRWQAFIDLPDDEAAPIEAALAAARDDLFHQRHPDAEEDEPARPGDISWADALGLVAERFLAAGEAERPWTDRYQVLFHYDLDPVGHPVFGPHGLPALPDCLRRYWMCDGSVKPITEIAGVPVSTAEAQRIVPRRIRRLIEYRDGGCRVPGCDRSRWVQAHHIIHWEDDGPTATWNLVCLCPHHHRLHHLGGLGITGNADKADGLVFTDQNERVLAGSGRPAPPGDPPDRAAQRLGLDVGHWQRAPGEPLQPGALYFNPPPSLN